MGGWILYSFEFFRTFYLTCSDLEVVKSSESIQLQHEHVDV